MFARDYNAAARFADKAYYNARALLPSWAFAVDTAYLQGEWDW